MDGACSSLSWLLGSARAEREEGGSGEGTADTSETGQTVSGYACMVGTRQTGKDCSHRVGVWHVSIGPFGSVRWNPIS